MIVFECSFLYFAENTTTNDEIPEQVQNWSGVSFVIQVFLPLAGLALIWKRKDIFTKMWIHLDRNCVSVFCPSFSKRDQMLKWAQRRLPSTWSSTHSRTLSTGLSELWSDGSLLCTLINTAVPGACPNPHRHWKKSPAHGQALAYKYLGVIPIFTDHDFENTFTTTRERYLLYYLTQINQAIGKLESEKILQSSSHAYIARGMGLYYAEQHREATFYVYQNTVVKQKTDVLIQIRGPYSTHGEAEVQFQKNIIPKIITPESRKEKSSTTNKRNFFLEQISARLKERICNKKKYVGDKIVITTETEPTRAKITYLPDNYGMYQINLISNGELLIGCPFDVNVTETNSCEEPEHNVKHLVTGRKVISKTIDFIDHQEAISNIEADTQRKSKRIQNLTTFCSFKRAVDEVTRNALIVDNNEKLGVAECDKNLNLDQEHSATKLDGENDTISDIKEKSDCVLEHVPNPSEISEPKDYPLSKIKEEAEEEANTSSKNLKNEENLNPYTDDSKLKLRNKLENSDICMESLQVPESKNIYETVKFKMENNLNNPMLNELTPRKAKISTINKTDKSLKENVIDKDTCDSLPISKEMTYLTSPESYELEPKEGEQLQHIEKLENQNLEAYKLVQKLKGSNVEMVEKNHNIKEIEASADLLETTQLLNNLNNNDATERNNKNFVQLPHTIENEKNAMKQNNQVTVPEGNRTYKKSLNFDNRTRSDVEKNIYKYNVYQNNNNDKMNNILSNELRDKNPKTLLPKSSIFIDNEVNGQLTRNLQKPVALNSKDLEVLSKEVETPHLRLYGSNHNSKTINENSAIPSRFFRFENASKEKVFASSNNLPTSRIVCNASPICPDHIVDEDDHTFTKLPVAERRKVFSQQNFAGSHSQSESDYSESERPNTLQRSEQKHRMLHSSGIIVESSTSLPDIPSSDEENIYIGFVRNKKDYWEKLSSKRSSSSLSNPPSDLSDRSPKKLNKQFIHDQTSHSWRRSSENLDIQQRFYKSENDVSSISNSQIILRSYQSVDTSLDDCTVMSIEERKRLLLKQNYEKENLRKSLKNVKKLSIRERPVQRISQLDYDRLDQSTNRVLPSVQEKVASFDTESLSERIKDSDKSTLTKPKDIDAIKQTTKYIHNNLTQEPVKKGLKQKFRNALKFFQKLEDNSPTKPLENKPIPQTKVKTYESVNIPIIKARLMRRRNNDYKLVSDMFDVDNVFEDVMGSRRGSFKGSPNRSGLVNALASFPRRSSFPVHHDESVEIQYNFFKNFKRKKERKSVKSVFDVIY